MGERAWCPQVAASLVRKELSPSLDPPYKRTLSCVPVYELSECLHQSPNLTPVTSRGSFSVSGSVLLCRMWWHPAGSQWCHRVVTSKCKYKTATVLSGRAEVAWLRSGSSENTLLRSDGAASRWLSERRLWEERDLPGT